MPKPKLDDIAAAIDRNFTTPNECDSNLEQPNVVDGLYRIARAIDRLATNHNDLVVAMNGFADAAHRLASHHEALSRLADAVEKLKT